MKSSLAATLIPSAVAVVGLCLLAAWANTGPSVRLERRLAGLDGAPRATPGKATARPLPGKPAYFDGRPSQITAEWPWFRGPDGDAIGKEPVRLAHRWPAGGPKPLWMIALGEGYAAAAVRSGCVYVLDHLGDADVLRCFSLDDGREIWRNSYPVVVAFSHGMSRTIPAVADDCVFSLGPLCHVACWEAATGKARWLIDLVAEHGATVPPWYAGQCKALVMAVDGRSGKVIWESPNPRHWTMTHVSIVPLEFAGRRMYVYCGKGGVAGVDAASGELLWDTTDWQVGVATCPSPVVVGEGKIFLCGGYNSGALMLQLRQEGGRITPHTLFRLSAKQFGSEQQTPVCWQGHLYGVRQRDRQLVCLDLEGRELWNSGADKFGQQGGAPYMIADGLLFAMTDEGLLRLVDANPDRYQRLDQAQVFPQGSDSWGPLALVAGRLIARDFTRMVCLDVAQH